MPERSALQALLVFFQVVTVLIAAVVSRAAMRRLVQHAKRRERDIPHWLESPLSSALVFGTVFVLVWLLLSTLLAWLWIIAWPR